MTGARRIGLLGGTFDPIHLGHLAAAEAARAALLLDEILLLTSHVPPHRPQPSASVHHRFAMVALAVQDRECLRASDLELLAPGPSYTAATLDRLQASGWQPSQLFFITGADAFAEIATWRRYPAVLDAAHFVVIARAPLTGADVRASVPALAGRMQEASANRPVGLTSEATGIFLVDAVTPDVSSTAVRARCADGLPLDGFVPPAVERHIRRHALYAQRGEASRAPAGHRHGGGPVA